MIKDIKFFWYNIKIHDSKKTNDGFFVYTKTGYYLFIKAITKAYHKYGIDVLKDKDIVSGFVMNYVLDKIFELGIVYRLIWIILQIYWQI